MNRREFIEMGALAGLAPVSGSSSVFEELPPVTPAASRRDLLTRRVVVPSDFVGMHFHHWPDRPPVSPAPTYHYGTVRSHDHGVAWNEIHTGPQQYKWDGLDEWVQTHSAGGKTLIYAVYGTPAWASSRNTVKDAYGHMGAGAPPTDMSVLADFVHALVTRYNGNGQRKIQFVETWNEPHFLQNDRGFWWGTVDQLVTVGRTIYKAAKQADAGVKVISPAFDGLTPGHLSFASTGISAGLREFLAAMSPNKSATERCFDAFSIHTYNADIMDPLHGLEGTMLQLTESLRNYGVSVPVYTTETGYTEDSAFARMPMEEKASRLRRQAAVQAAFGIRSLCFYSHDDEFCGNPSQNAQIATAINDVHVNLAGKTLKQVSILADGSVQVTTETGQVQW